MKPLVARVALTVGLIVFGAVLLTACSPQKRDAEFQDLPGLISAMKAFSRDVTNAGRPLPDSVSLTDLVRGGYISSNSVHALAGMETRVYLKPSPADPAAVLVSATSADGTVLAAMGDGSVQRFSAERFAAQFQKSANGSTSTNSAQASPAPQ